MRRRKAKASEGITLDRSPFRSHLDTRTGEVDQTRRPLIRGAYFSSPLKKFTGVMLTCQVDDKA
jgi:hypothetical protein